MVTEVREEQPSKARVPIYSKESDKVMESNLGQSLKVAYWIVFSLIGKTIDVNSTQWSNAVSPIEVIESGNDTDVSVLQHLKAASPIEVTG